MDEFEFVTNGAKARLLTLLNELPKWTAFDCDAIHFENDLGEEIPEGKALQKMNRAFLMHDMVQPPKPLTKRGLAALLRSSDESS